jgi:uncharacterized phage protein (TIGR01671 family)
MKTKLRKEADENREIKFRKWSPIHGMTEIIKISEFKYLNDIFKSCNGKDGIILMQYTGLRDKNGKEIWEGDIIYLGLQLLNDKKDECIVIFEDGSFKATTYEGIVNLCKFYTDKGEVKGNIYE